MKLILKAGTFLLFCAAVFNEVNACTCLDYGVPIDRKGRCDEKAFAKMLDAGIKK